MYSRIVMSDEQECIRLDDGQKVFLIPTDPANTDYQAYLEWVAEGNTALVIEDDS